MVDLHADALLPNPWPSWVKRAIWAVLGILVIICGLYGWSCVARSRSDSHQTAANQAHESSVIHAAQGATYDQQAQAQAQDLQSSEREALNLRASLAAKEGLLKAERWKGRIEGFAVGFAGGYATGRLN